MSGSLGGKTPTMSIRDHLCTRLGLQPKSLRIIPYPTGPSRKHTFWWREGAVDYAEAQYFLQIAGEYPMCAVGVSVEKGLEGPGFDAAHAMDRNLWHWPRLVAQAGEIFGNLLPDIQEESDRSITVRLRAKQHRNLMKRLSHVLSLNSGAWTERHVGHRSLDEIVGIVKTLDQSQDYWVDSYFTFDLTAQELEFAGPDGVAEILLRFEPLWRAFR